MQDLIMYIFLIAFQFNSCNWGLDFLVTTPFVAVAQYQVSLDAFSIEDGNMDCFNYVAETMGTFVANRWMAIIVMLVVNVYIKTGLELNEFVEHENSTDQQESFKNILENQLDGIIILAESKD